MNIKQKLFCDLYTDINYENYGNATKCYQEVYNVESERVAETNASRLLSNAKIKSYIEDKSKSISEILEQNKVLLINHALNMSLGKTDRGNTAVLNKLIDKIAPTLNYNDNINQVETIDSLLNKMYEERVKYVNKAESSKSEDVPQDSKPVSVDNKTS